MKRPAGRLTPTQEAMVRRMAGTTFIKNLARAVGTSNSNLDRWAKQNRVNINALAYRPETIRSVCSYYEKHGLQATQDAFPNVRVRSIVERFKNFAPRLIRWSDEQIIEAAKMAGLVSHKAQAKYFNRPNANEGSIRSLWIRKFKISGGSVNGMVNWYAKELVDVKVEYLKPKGMSKGEVIEFRRLILWVDLERYLKAEVPRFIRDAIKTMADFQRWLWKSDNPKPLILKMIKEREL